MRDLLGVDLRPGRDFPQDDSGYGFDNNGDVLSLSPALMERYVMAAERVARAALFGPDAPEARARALRRRRGARSSRQPAVPAEYDATGLSSATPSTPLTASRSTGEYVVRAILGGERPAGSEPRRGRLLRRRPASRASLALDPEGLGSFSASTARTSRARRASSA